MYEWVHGASSTGARSGVHLSYASRRAVAGGSGAGADCDCDCDCAAN